MIKELDEKWSKSEYLLFQDKGPVSKGAVTRRFEVTTRLDKIMLGYVRWYPQWRQYCFYPTDCLLNKTCLRDIAEFVEIKTNKQRENWPKELKHSEEYKQKLRERCQT